MILCVHSYITYLKARLPVQNDNCILTNGTWTQKRVGFLGSVTAVLRIILILLHIHLAYNEYCMYHVEKESSKFFGTLPMACIFKDWREIYFENTFKESRTKNHKKFITEKLVNEKELVVYYVVALVVLIFY